MKKEGSLKTILAILVIILLCLVSFGGVFVKNKNVMKNVLPEYVLGMDLDTNTVLKLDVQKDESSENQEGQADKYNADNYKKAKEIIEKRLKLSGVEQYTIRLDEKTGSIVLEFPDKVDNSIIGYAVQNGDVTVNITSNIKDETTETEETADETADETEDTTEDTTDENANDSTESQDNSSGVTGIIADNKSIKSVTIASKNMEYVKQGGAYVEMQINFTGEAIKKFKEIQNNYVVPKDADGNETDNTVTIFMDGTQIYAKTETLFLQSAVNGSVVVDSNYAADAKDLTSIENTFNSAKALLETEKLPIKYTPTYENKIHSNISNAGIIGVFAVISVVMLIYLILKYKLNGLYAELSILGFGALLLLMLRWTSVQISVASLTSIAGMLVLQFIYLIKILNNKKTSSKAFTEKTIEFSKILVPAFIFGIFAAVLPALKNVGIIPGNIFEIASFGMVIFWGLIVFEVFNNIITRAILTNAKNK
ncbi:MAG: hypothetical protein IJ690_04810 [Clostridia bacterium]|nr:hypothetical protein [Clostridia bacterium]